MIVVMLRRPRKNDPRKDPYFEYGSFGLTGCHRTNLLADDAAAGHRLAFAQGGPSGFRLVMLTPEVDVRSFSDCHEAFWSPAEMPLRYERAPMLIGRAGATDVPLLLVLLTDVRRPTWEARFASAFRTRKKPVLARVAASIVNVWNRAVQDDRARAAHYWQALPWRPEVIDDDRLGSHRILRENAAGSLEGASRSSFDRDRPKRRSPSRC